MAYTQADIDTLKAAIVSQNGAQEITFNDRTVRFRSLEEMRDHLAQMQREVNGTPGGRTRYVTSSKGV